LYRKGRARFNANYLSEGLVDFIEGAASLLALQELAEAMNARYAGQQSTIV
jgi:hypothetical protein